MPSAPPGAVEGTVHRLLPRYGFIRVGSEEFFVLPSAVQPPVTFGALQVGMRVLFLPMKTEHGLRAAHVHAVDDTSHGNGHAPVR